MQPRNGKDRVLFIDVARFLAISLVFYGHFVERMMYLNNPTAAAQYKFIYAFHMVAFIVLAGYVAQEKDLSLSIGSFLKRRMLSRLLPFAFFSLLFMGMAGVFPGDFFHLKLPSVEGYAKGLISTIFGIPLFCVPSWFLMLIFSIELIHRLVFRFLKSDAKVLIAIIFFYAVGFIINWKFDIIDLAEGKLVGRNYLFIHEAVIMYAFYLLGVLMGKERFLQRTESPKTMLVGALAMFLAVLFTYRLNRGFFSFSKLDAVVILLSSHGHFIWFPLTAIAGSLMILLIARSFPQQKTIVWMGQNTLILMCLNGIFYHYVNPPMAKWVVGHLPGTPWIVLLAGTMMTVASLLACIPLIHLLNKWVPQLVGKPKTAGPLLRSLI